MFEIIAIAAALIGGFAAGLWDLKTSDIPDEVPAVMVVLGLFLWFVAGLTTGNWTPLMTSAMYGALVFAIGWGLYKAGQWGGGDAALVAGIFFLIPNTLFLTEYIFNFFLVALGYSVIYSIAVGLAHPAVFRYTAAEIARKKIWVVLLVWFVFGILAIPTISVMSGDSTLTALLWLAVFGLIIFYVYAKAIEQKIFHKRVPIGKLRVGDVVATSKRWEGITAAQIAALKRKHIRFVQIKEGVRFGMVFPLTLVFTLLFGNVMFWLAGLI